MSNLALYRKYRPKTFAEVVGQEHIIRILTGALTQDIVSHAYLFAGPKGTGKTTVARLLAKALNCQNRKEHHYEPCNQCESCREINEGRSIDLIEIDAASNRGIDDIRRLKEGIRFMPVKSKYKVFIIDESHQLTKDASDALLKTLEEPPAHAIFILATTELNKMKPTIVSRCQKFDFHLLTNDQVRKKLETILKGEKAKAEPKALSMIIQNAQGALRSAESLLDECLVLASVEKHPKITATQVQNLLGLVEPEAISQLADLILGNKTSQSLQLLDQLVDQGSNPEEINRTLTSYLRKILLFKISPKFKDLTTAELPAEERKTMVSLGKKHKVEDIRRVVDLLMSAQSRISYSYIPQLPIELAIVQFCEKIK